jgi:transcriptional regulator with XRE-family HTH domain
MPSSGRSARRPQTVEQAFGQVLRALREERGLSQEQLGHEIESGRTYISQLERGERGPSLKMIFRLSAHLDKSPSEIVKRVERELGSRPRA